MNIPGQQQWWYQYTPVPNGSGGWTYTYTPASQVVSSGTSTKTEQANVRDIPGWKRTPVTAAGLLEEDGLCGWTSLASGNDKNIVMDARGGLYVWKNTTLTPGRVSAEDWGVQLWSYQVTSDSQVKIAAYIPAKASAHLKILNRDKYLYPSTEYFMISKVSGKPVDR